MRGWFQLILGSRAETNLPTCRAFAKKRLKGFEPSTFCMASAQAGGSFGFVERRSTSDTTSDADASGTIRRGLGSEIGPLPTRGSGLVKLTKVGVYIRRRQGCQRTVVVLLRLGVLFSIDRADQVDDRRTGQLQLVQ